MKFRLAALLGVVVALLIPGAAHATDPVVNTVHVISTPDDGTPPWARDSFTRTTKITGSGEDWQVEIADEGTFKAGDVTGAFSGHATWLVTGGAPTADIPATWDDIDRSAEAAKGDFTSGWWARFFGEGSTSTGIEDWEWTYSRCSGEAKKARTENEQGVTGASYDELKQAVCPTPSATPAATTPPATNPATAEPSSTPVAGGEETLPKTGPGVATAAGIGGAVVLVGAALFVGARRRRDRFTA